VKSPCNLSIKDYTEIFHLVYKGDVPSIQCKTSFDRSMSDQWEMESGSGETREPIEKWGVSNPGQVVNGQHESGMRKQSLAEPLGDWRVDHRTKAGCGLEDRESNIRGEIGRNNSRDQREDTRKRPFSGPIEDGRAVHQTKDGCG
jgi:hypothetical protein